VPLKLKAMVLLAGCLGCLQASNLFLNPGFESPDILDTSASLPSGSTELTGWTVTGGCGINCIAILDDAYAENAGGRILEFHAHGGLQSVDLTGSGNTLVGGIAQTVTLHPGSLYNLSFWVGNMDDTAPFNYPLASSVQVLLDGNSLGVFTNSNNLTDETQWTRFSAQFTATLASHTIEFRNATPAGDNMAGLDDVSIAAIPEPPAFALGGIGLIATAGLIRRARSRRPSNPLRPQANPDRS
jgi:hypothetical protein